jgi:NTE family protein
MGFFRTRPYKIGLALGSGAARGIAHIGVIKALKEAGIPIDMVAGTSMGAMVGACFAREGNVDAIEEMALNINPRHFAHILDPHFSSLRKGIFQGDRIEEMLYSLVGDIEFKDMKIPFAAVAVDIHTGHEIVIKEGSVVDAVRASISLPGIFVPVLLEGGCLVDGGLINPVPINTVRDMGATFIIAVNVLTDPKKRKSLALFKEDRTSTIPNILDTLIQSLLIMEYEIIKMKTLDADIVISPDVSNIEAFEFHKGRQAISQGYSAAKDSLPKLEKHIIKG